jgi:hypothetical protein
MIDRRVRAFRQGLARSQTRVQDGRSRDQHRVLVVDFIPDVVFGLPRTAHQQRLHTHQRHILLGRKLIQYALAMPRRLTPHGHIGETTPAGFLAGPLQHRAQLPGLRSHSLAGQHPRIMIGEHQRLLLIGQVDSHDRVIDPNRTAQPGQPGIAVLATTREPATQNHDVLFDALGRTRQRHQDDVLSTFIDTQRHNSLATHA